MATLHGGRFACPVCVEGYKCACVDICVYVRTYTEHPLFTFVFIVFTLFFVFNKKQVSVKYLWTRCDRMSGDRCHDL